MNFCDCIRFCFQTFQRSSLLKFHRKQNKCVSKKTYVVFLLCFYLGSYNFLLTNLSGMSLSSDDKTWIQLMAGNIQDQQINVKCILWRVVVTHVSMCTRIVGTHPTMFVSAGAYWHAGCTKGSEKLHFWCCLKRLSSRGNGFRNTNRFRRSFSSAFRDKQAEPFRKKTWRTGIVNYFVFKNNCRFSLFAGSLCNEKSWNAKD